MSPGQFLAAVRIYQAKRMLPFVSPMSVAARSSSRRSATAALARSRAASSIASASPPGRFRTVRHQDGVTMCPRLPEAPVPQGGAAGTVRLPEGYAAARVYIGIFDTRIMQRRPQSAVLLDLMGQRAHPYWLPGVPPGRWYLHAVAVADTDEPEPWTRRHLLVGGGDQVQAALGAITLRPRSQTDLPALVALPDLEVELEGLTRSMAQTKGW